MYNVTEAYLHTVKYGGQTYVKLHNYVDQDIKKRVQKGFFYDVFNLEHKDYSIEDIDRLEDYLIYLGYEVFRAELTNEVTQLRVSWTKVDMENYLDKESDVNA